MHHNCAVTAYLEQLNDLRHQRREAEKDLERGRDEMRLQERLRSEAHVEVSCIRSLPC